MTNQILCRLRALQSLVVIGAIILGACAPAAEPTAVPVAEVASPATAVAAPAATDASETQAEIEPVLGLANASGVEVCEIYLAARNADSWGEPLALEALPDGGEDVYFPPAPGVYDGAAVDCAGELIEEQAGMDLNGLFIWVIGEQALAIPRAEEEVVADEVAAEEEAAPAPLEVGGVLASAAARGLVWDTGFRATANGFGFENYGGDFPEGNFTAADAAAFWGDTAICASGSGEGCVPKPSAQAWIDAANAAGDGGHCAGFTVAAFRLFDGELDPGSLGAASTASLERSIPVMRRLALDFQMQFLPEIYAATVNGTPLEIVQKLQKEKRPVDIGIYAPPGSSGGHSVVGYGLEDLGNNQYKILVYDNNWPGRENSIEVDGTANTWVYSLSATNPKEDSGAWYGDAQTQTLNYVPRAAYLPNGTGYGLPFAKADSVLRLARPANAGATGSTSFSLNTKNAAGANIALLLSTPDGKTVGVGSDGVLQNDIPGATIVRPKGSVQRRPAAKKFDPGNKVTLEPIVSLQPPVISVPAAGAYSVAITGAVAAAAELHAVGPGFAFAASGVQAGAGQTAGDAITINPAAGSVNYAPAGAAKPILTLTTAGADGETVFTLGGVSFEAGQLLAVQVDPTAGTLALSGTGIGKDNLVLVATKVGNDGTIKTFATDGIVLAAAGSQVLDFGAWDGTGAMNMGIDADGDGALESTRALADEPLGVVINDLGSASQIADGMAASAAYMDEADTASFLSALAGAGLSADQLGGVLLELDAANFSTAELQAFVVEAGLADDMGMFAGFSNSLGLGDEDFAGLTEALGFDAAVLETLNGLMDAQQALEESAYELARSDMDPSGRAAFIATLGFTPDQLGDFLDFTNIDGAELAGLVTYMGIDPQDLAGVMQDLDLDPGALGAILDGLGLQGAQEIELLGSLDLDAAELGAMLAGMNVEGDELGTLLEGLELDAAELGDVLGNLELEGDELGALVEGLDLDASELGDVLGNMGLEGDELGALVEGLDLDAAATDALLSDVEAAAADSSATGSDEGGGDDTGGDEGGGD